MVFKYKLQDGTWVDIPAIRGKQGAPGPPGPHVEVLQNTGDSEEATMSQRAITRALANVSPKDNYMWFCGQKHRLITIDLPFTNYLDLGVNECGGYLWLFAYQSDKFARIDLATEEVYIGKAPANAYRTPCVNVTTDGEYFYYGPTGTTSAIYKCDNTLTRISSVPTKSWCGGIYYDGCYWCYSGSTLYKYDLQGVEMASYDAPGLNYIISIQPLYDTGQTLINGQFVYDPSDDTLTKLSAAYMLTEGKIGGVTRAGWGVPALITGYDAATHTFTTVETANKSALLGITNGYGRVNERCVVGNSDCREVAISFGKGYYVTGLNQPLPFDLGARYYAGNGWMTWIENNQVKFLNLL